MGERIEAWTVECGYDLILPRSWRRAKGTELVI